MYCPTCGAPNDEDAHFCKSCGSSLTSSVARGSSTTIRDPQRGPSHDDGESLAFVEALHHVFADVGISLLHNPSRLLAYTADICNTDVPEFRVFEYNCDAELLEPFTSLTSGTPNKQELDEAADRVHLILCDRSIESQAAARVSVCLRNAIARTYSLPEIPLPPVRSEFESSSATAVDERPSRPASFTTDGRSDGSQFAAPHESSATAQAPPPNPAYTGNQVPYPPTPPAPKRPTGLMALVAVLAILAIIMGMAAYKTINANAGVSGGTEAASNTSKSGTATVEVADEDSKKESGAETGGSVANAVSNTQKSAPSPSDSKSKQGTSTPAENSPSSSDTQPAPKPDPEPTPEPTPAPATNHADSFPRKWSGTYVGTSSYVEGDHHINRAVAFNWTTVTESGHLEGICYVGTEDAGPGETYGTCYVSGDVNWDSGEINFSGTEWIDQGGLGDLRQYSGTVDLSSRTMSGSAWDVGTGLYETPWNVSAVDQISIMQNGSVTTA